MARLIIKDSAGIMKGTIDLGWRIKTKEGYHDIIWGNTRDDATLRQLLHDPEWRQHLPVEIIDERIETAGDKPLVPPTWWNG